MYKRLVAAGFFAAGVFSQPVQATPDPLALYGERIHFDIQRKGRTIGSHIVTFAREGEHIRTRSEVRISINFLFFNAFRYSYDSEAIWREDGLQHLDVAVNDNGKHVQLKAMREGAEIAVMGTAGAFTAPPSTQPTEHWNAGILSGREVLNTLTGKLNTVEIVPGVSEQVPSGAALTAATHYRYTGDLSAEVWYDDAGRWVKMRFKGRDGSMIDYICRQCQGPSQS